jgi:hypothetical protein
MGPAGRGRACRGTRAAGDQDCVARGVVSARETVSGNESGKPDRGKNRIREARNGGTWIASMPSRPGGRTQESGRSRKCRCLTYIISFSFDRDSWTSTHRSRDRALGTGVWPRDSRSTRPADPAPEKGTSWRPPSSPRKRPRRSGWGGRTGGKAGAGARCSWRERGRGRATVAECGGVVQKTTSTVCDGMDVLV